MKKIFIISLIFILFSSFPLLADIQTTHISDFSSWNNYLFQGENSDYSVMGSTISVTGDGGGGEVWHQFTNTYDNSIGIAGTLNITAMSGCSQIGFRQYYDAPNGVSYHYHFNIQYCNDKPVLNIFYQKFDSNFNQLFREDFDYNEFELIGTDIQLSMFLYDNKMWFYCNDTFLKTIEVPSDAFLVNKRRDLKSWIRNGFDSTINAEWKSVNIITEFTYTPPNRPDLLSPSNDASIIYLTPTLTTNSFSDPNVEDNHSQTDWEISTSADFSSNVLYEESTTNLTSFTVPEGTLQNNIMYYWRVRFADNHSNFSTWSEVFSFTTVEVQSKSKENGLPILHINIDGISSDWSSIDPLIIDTLGDSQTPSHAGTDISEAYIATNDAEDTIFIRIDVSGQVNNEPCNQCSDQTSGLVQYLIAFDDPEIDSPNTSGFDWQIGFDMSGFWVWDIRGDKNWDDQSNLTYFPLAQVDAKIAKDDIIEFSFPRSFINNTITAYVHPYLVLNDGNGTNTDHVDTNGLIGTGRPLPARLYSPNNESINIALTTTLVTDEFIDPDTGNTHSQTDWEISTSADFSSSILYEESTTDLTSFTVPGGTFQESTMYYWRVRFSDNHSNVSEWSNPFSFSTLDSTLPDVCQKVIHTSPSSTTTNKPTSFIWEQDDHATYYKLWIGYPDGTKIFSKWYDTAQICSNGSCVVNPLLELAEESYEWYVKSWNDNSKIWSDGMAFTVQTGETIPSGITHTSPTGLVIDTTPTFVWDHDLASTWYKLWIGYTSGEKHLATWHDASQICSSGKCSVTLETELANGEYDWFVKSWNENGNIWSDGMSFSVDR